MTYIAILTTGLTALLAGAEPSTSGSAQDPSPAQNSRPVDADQDRGVLAPGEEAILSVAFSRLEQVISVAGSRTVTAGDVINQIQSDPAWRNRGQRAAARAAEREDLFQDAWISRIRTLLMVEAGQTLGFDPEMLDVTIDGAFEQNIERLGGHTAFSEALQGSMLTPNSFREFLTTRVLAQSWRDSVSGRAPGATGRVYVDRYISPGELKATYDRMMTSSQQVDKEVLGALPERVVLSVLVIRETPGAVNSAEDRARGLRELAEEGHSWSSIIAMHGSEGLKDTQFRPIPLELIRTMSVSLHGSDELSNFSREAEVGEFLGPLKLQEAGNQAGWSVYKLEERLPEAKALPFESLELQKRLRQHLLELRDNSRVETALRTFASQAYIFPADLREALDL